MSQQVGRIFQARAEGGLPESFATELYNLSKKKKRDMVMKNKLTLRRAGVAWTLQHSPAPDQPMLGLCDFLNTLFLVRYCVQICMPLLALRNCEQGNVSFQRCPH